MSRVATDAERSQIQSSFGSLGLTSDVIGKLQRLSRVTYPSEIQNAAIPLLAENTSADAVIHAPTGTGKTLAYMLPAIARVMDAERRKVRGVKALIVVPTRELAKQVTDLALLLNKQGSKKHRVAGRARPTTVRRLVGQVTRHTLSSLQRDPPDLIVGTPNMLAQLIPAQLPLGALEMVVLDEVDFLAQNHARDSTEHILRCVTKPRHRPQVVFVSATSSAVVERWRRRFLRSGRKGKTLEADLTESQLKTTPDTKHLVLQLAAESQRFRVVHRLLASMRPSVLLVFAASAEEAAALVEDLRSKGRTAAAIVPGMANRDRQRTRERMRQGQVQVVVATAGASRGLDFPTVTHVLNLGLPTSAVDYLHRAGRTGRLSSFLPEGVVISTCLGQLERRRVERMHRKLAGAQKLQQLTLLPDSEWKVTPFMSTDTTPSSSSTKGALHHAGADEDGVAVGFEEACDDHGSEAGATPQRVSEEEAALHEAVFAAMRQQAGQTDEDGVGEDGAPAAAASTPTAAAAGAGEGGEFDDLFDDEDAAADESAAGELGASAGEWIDGSWVVADR